MSTATMALKISDGTTTVDLIYHSVSNPGYQLAQDWAPQVAAIRRSELGGRGPYEDVAEEIPVRVFGTSAADAYSKLDTLNRLLDQAERWWHKWQAVSPVTLRYSPPGASVSSVASPLQALILGRADDNAGSLVLPPSFNKLVNAYVIDGARVKILRRGAWTGASDASSTSGSAANTTVLSRGLGSSHPISSPVDVVIGGFTLATTPTIQPGYLIVGNAATDIQVFEGEAMAAGAFTSVNDSANLARGNNVLRYTPAGTTAVASGGQSLIQILDGPAAIIAAVRNNSATTTFQLQAVLSGFGNTVTTPPVLIDTSSAQPRHVLLGTVTASGASALAVQVQASAASGTLDIDYLIVVRLRDETVAIIAHDAMSTTGFSAGAFTLQATFSPLADKVPLVRAVSSGGGAVTYAAYRGPLPLLVTGDTLFALWTATNGQYWRFTNVSNTIVNVTLQATRYRSYVSPQ